MHDSMKNLVSLLEKKINEVVMTGDMPSDELRCIKDATETIYYAKVIEAMEDSKREPSYDYDSHRRGRSPMTGRFVSREMMPSHQRHYDTGYSGHSIEDRMIEKLELMLDSAASQYERDTILRTIEDIKMGM